MVYFVSGIRRSVGTFNQHVIKVGTITIYIHLIVKLLRNSEKL